jgi:CubicO group peptidase (beta-lactamase class C family)
MKRLPLILGCAALGTFAPIGAVMLAGSAAPAPWKSITAEQAGMDASALNAWKEALAKDGTTGLLVIRRGAIAFEWYAANSGADKPHGAASMAKALVGGTSLLVALSDGLISPDDLASKYIPGWNSDPLKSRITIRQLATHTSGIEDAEQDSLPHNQLPGWKGAFWKRLPDPFSVACVRRPSFSSRVPGMPTAIPAWGRWRTR